MAHADTEWNVSKPVGSTTTVAELDTVHQTFRKAVQERFNVDHDATETSSVVATVTDGGGKHRQVTFTAVQATPSPSSGEAILYTVDDDTDEQLAFIANTDATEIQLTKGDAVFLGANGIGLAIDDETLNATTTDWAGDAFDPAKTAIVVNLDDSTLEYDSSGDAIRIKTPAVPDSGADAYPDAIAAPVMAYGSYTGNSSALTIDTGIAIKHLIVRSDLTGGTNGGGIEGIVCDAGTRFWRQSGTSIFSSGEIQVSGTTFIVGAADAKTNSVGQSYYWVAYGTR